MSWRKSYTLDVTQGADAEYELAIKGYLGGLRLLHEQMKEDQQEMKTLRAETDAILNEIMHTLLKAQAENLVLPSDVRRSVIDVLAEAPGHLAFQDAEPVDAYVQAERDTWI